MERVSRYDELMKGWNPSLTEWMWLTPGTHWSDLDKPEYAHIEDLLKWVAVGVPIVMLLRYVLERHLFVFIGRKLGLRERLRPIRMQPQPVLEAFYGSNKRRTRGGLKAHLLDDLAAQTGMAPREIDRWFRKRRQVDIVPPMVKFSESLFKAIFYAFTFCYGFILLLNRPWLWDFRQAFHEFPYHAIDDGSKFYYAVELSYYTAALITLNIDVKRKDFTEMVVHHWATIALMAFSYMANFWRGGTVVLLVHDMADVVLESAKCLKYAGRQQWADNLFVVFAAYFFLSRLVFFPYVVIWGTLTFGPEEILNETFYTYISKGHLVPCHAIFSVLLLVLLGLHLFWFSIIVKMAIKFMKAGSVEKDDRSDDEEEEEEEDMDEGKKGARGQTEKVTETTSLLPQPPSPDAAKTPRRAA